MRWSEPGRCGACNSGPYSIRVDDSTPCPTCGKDLAATLVDIKPLHVQVAEAVGCSPVPPGRPRRSRVSRQEWLCGCTDGAHATEGVDGAPGEGETIERYDTDWSATGPLIERIGIDVGLDRPGLWTAAICQPDKDLTEAYGPSPLVAVCRLVLALAAAGKLNAKD